jgi:hypothetical protein
MLRKVECLSTSSFHYAVFTINEFTLENVTSALSVTVASHCKEQSAFMFSNRRLSITL